MMLAYKWMVGASLLITATSAMADCESVSYCWTQNLVKDAQHCDVCPDIRQSRELKLVGSAIERYQACAALFSNFASARADESIAIRPEARKEMDELLYINAAEPKTGFRNATERLQYLWKFKNKLEDFKDRFLTAKKYLDVAIEMWDLRKERAPDAPQLGMNNRCIAGFSANNDISACTDNNIQGTLKYMDDVQFIVMKTNTMQCISVLPGAIDVVTSALKDRWIGQK